MRHTLSCTFLRSVGLEIMGIKGMRGNIPVISLTSAIF